MVKTCSAKNCRESASKDSPLSFHTFPKNPELRKKWIEATCREDFNPSVHAVICNKHFSQTQYVFDFGKTMRTLKKDAIPNAITFCGSSKAVAKPGGPGRLARRRTKYSKKVPVKLNSNPFTTTINSVGIHVDEPDVDIQEKSIAVVENNIENQKTNEQVQEIKRNFAKHIKGALSGILTESFSDTKIRKNDIYCNQNPTNINQESTSTKLLKLSRNSMKDAEITKQHMQLNKNNVIENAEDPLSIELFKPVSIELFKPVRNGTCIESTEATNLNLQTTADINAMLVRKRKDNSQHFGFFRESDLDCPENAKKMWNAARTTIATQRKKLNTLRIQKARLTRSVATLKEVLKFTEEQLKTVKFQEDTSALPHHIRLLRQIEQCNGKRFPTELRTFALSLYYYSKKAYKFFRETFDNTLPHSRTLRKWLAAIENYHNAIDSAQSV